MTVEPFGADRGWKTIVGWLIFGLGALGAAFAAAGHQFGLGVEPEGWLAVIGVGAAWAGIGHRDAQAKQTRTVRDHIDKLGKFVDILTNPGAALTGDRPDQPPGARSKKQ